MIDLVARHRDEIGALCRHFGVRRLDLFGSAATGAFDPATSDLDFIATFADTDAPNYAERYLDFAEALEALFNRPVDIIIDRSIRNPSFRQAFDATRQSIYSISWLDSVFAVKNPHPLPAAQRAPGPVRRERGFGAT